MKGLLLIGAIVLASLISGLITHPERSGTPQAFAPQADFLTVQQVPSGISTLLTSSCYHCHSHKTDYPWYANFQPFGWYVGKQVHKGRTALHFSTWQHLSIGERGEQIEEMISVINSSTEEHPQIDLNSEDRETLTAWLEGVRDQLD